MPGQLHHARSAGAHAAGGQHILLPQQAVEHGALARTCGPKNSNDGAGFCKALPDGFKLAGPVLHILL